MRIRNAARLIGFHLVFLNMLVGTRVIHEVDFARILTDAISNEPALAYTYPPDNLMSFRIIISAIMFIIALNIESIWRLRVLVSAGLSSAATWPSFILISLHNIGTLLALKVLQSAVVFIVMIFLLGNNFLPFSNLVLDMTIIVVSLFAISTWYISSMISGLKQWLKNTNWD